MHVILRRPLIAALVPLALTVGCMGDGSPLSAVAPPPAGGGRPAGLVRVRFGAIERQFVEAVAGEAAPIPSNPGESMRPLGNPLIGTVGTNGGGLVYYAKAPGLDRFVAEVNDGGKTSVLFMAVRVRPASVDPRIDITSQAWTPPVDPRLAFSEPSLDNPDLDELRPLVRQIIADFGGDTTDLGRARALRDWVARTAVHPHTPIHEDTSTANLSVLPPGKTWADVNHYINYNFPNIIADNLWWETAFGQSGTKMLDSLLGTVDPSTGERRDDGIMQHVAGSHWRMRSVEGYHYIQCSDQDRILVALWAAAGLHGMLISTSAHDPAAVYIPSLGSWVYEDPTFNEEFTIGGTGVPVSPVAMLAVSSAGLARQLLVPRKTRGPWWDPAPYGQDSFILEHPTGMAVLGSQLNSGFFGVVPIPHLVQIETPALATDPVFSDRQWYTPVTPDVAFPDLGVTIRSASITDDVATIELGVVYPGPATLQRQLGNGPWVTLGSTNDRVEIGPRETTVHYRAVGWHWTSPTSTIVVHGEARRGSPTA